MNRIVLLLLVTVSACAGKQALRVDCERHLVPINEPVEQVEDSQLESQPKGEEQQRP